MGNQGRFLEEVAYTLKLEGNCSRQRAESVYRLETETESGDAAERVLDPKSNKRPQKGSK